MENKLLHCGSKKEIVRFIKSRWKCLLSLCPRRRELNTNQKLLRRRPAVLRHVRALAHLLSRQFTAGELTLNISCYSGMQRASVRILPRDCEASLV